MSEWQPIETAPKGRLILAWMEGHSTHSGVNWRRAGFALIAMGDDGPVKHLLEAARDRIIGPFRVDAAYLEPTHWTPLPEEPK